MAEWIDLPRELSKFQIIESEYRIARRGNFMDHVEEWCEENMKGSWEFKIDGRLIPVRNMPGSTVHHEVIAVRFSDDRDAILFKMFWIDG